MTILGPFTRDEWTTMLFLKEDISFMQGVDPIKYQPAIVKERIILKSFYKREAA